MVRKIASITAGVLIFFLLAFLAGATAQALWPAYAAAIPDRAYTLPMLLARLATGAAATAFAGLSTSWLAGDRLRSALWLGLILLAINLPWHIKIWNEYPTWYHLVWLGSLIPCALIGGRAAR